MILKTWKLKWTQVKMSGQCKREKSVAPTQMCAPDVWIPAQVERSHQEGMRSVLPSISSMASLVPMCLYRAEQTFQGFEKTHKDYE